ncbi:MAG TPA: PLP-dependent aminotransferase family protein [Steroidobacteraceae bacterium]|jgi:GntR family transcriptional regulator/MocR family aminotransferase
MKTPLHLPLERGGNSVPAYRQIYDRIRRAILAGSLPPGTRLPSWNSLATQLGVARGTVKAAYDWLAGEGYIVGRGAAGTIVPPDLRTHRAAPLTRHAANNPSLAGRSSLLDSPLIRPFQMGLPALDAFPRKLWTRIAAQTARRFDDTALGHGSSTGHRPLREAVASYLAVGRGLACTPEQVFITCGYTGALELACRALVEPGDKVWSEDPAYFRTLSLLELAGARIVPVPVDEEGLRVRAGVALAADAKMAVVTPSHQSPLGMPLSLSRRLELLEWATRRKRWVLEDDYYGELNLEGRPMPSLASLDDAGRVLYAGTFSKTLVPTLRVGYLVVPADQVEHFERVALALLPAPAALIQHTVAEFMRLGHFGRHMWRMRKLYAQRKASLVLALEREFGSKLRIDAGTGLHLVAWLPQRADDEALERRAVAAGLAVTALSSATIRTARAPALLLSVTNVAARNATRDVRRLAQALAL